MMMRHATSATLSKIGHKQQLQRLCNSMLHDIIAGSFGGIILSTYNSITYGFRRVGMDVAMRFYVDDRMSIDESKNPELLSDLCSKILCWVCSTEKPDSAVPLAQALARLHKGECHVVMSLDVPNGTPGGHSAGNHSFSGRCTPLTPEIINRAKQELAHLYGDDVFTLVLPGHPITEIKRYARNKKVKLIIVGEQGLAAEREYGQKLCDDAPCTVLTLFIPTPPIEEKNSHPALSGMEYRGGPER
jgi:hypothetical protein